MGVFLQLQLCECQPECADNMCEMYCEHGFQQDENGCDMCQCNECSLKQCRMLCAHGFKKGPDGCQVSILTNHFH